MKSQKSEEVAVKGRKTATSLSEQELPAPDTFSPEQQFPGESRFVLSEQEEPDAARMAATGGLAIILGQLVTYFTNRAHIDDLDVLSFSLHHLFCRVDFLYNKALPALATWTLAAQTQPMQQEARQRQQIWTQLQTINRTLDRMEPLCHLLSDATECILENFDLTSDIIPLADNSNTQAQDESNGDKGWLQVIDAERWEQAFSAVTQHLLSWQEQHNTLPALTTQFSHLLPTTPTLPELDAAFATVLDNAGAIFGDILPGFRAILSADESMIAALLYDLMQQSDQLLVKFDTTLEPMNTLIKYFAIGPELS
ncbi:MAG TPA: hypothetical protein VNE38_08235 [Ktedonobacteraceae bacterium]|nr:hypothetical protein [Ktedonobacteraceae bacterium]